MTSLCYRQASKESLASQDSRSTRARREEQEVERKVESFQQNRAAKSIQQGFKNMKERKRRQEEDEVRKYLQIVQFIWKNIMIILIDRILNFDARYGVYCNLAWCMVN